MKTDTWREAAGWRPCHGPLGSEALRVVSGVSDLTSDRLVQPWATPLPLPTPPAGAQPTRASRRAETLQPA